MIRQIFGSFALLSIACLASAQARPQQDNNCVEIQRARTDNNYCSGRPALIVEFRNRCSAPIVFKLCTAHLGGWACASGSLEPGEQTSNGIRECGRYTGEYRYWGFIDEPGVNMYNYLPPDPR